MLFLVSSLYKLCLTRERVHGGCHARGSLALQRRVPRRSSGYGAMGRRRAVPLALFSGSHRWLPGGCAMGASGLGMARWALGELPLPVLTSSPATLALNPCSGHPHSCLSNKTSLSSPQGLCTVASSAQAHHPQALTFARAAPSCLHRAPPRRELPRPPQALVVNSRRWN